MGKQSVGLDQARRILASLGQVGAGFDLGEFRLGVETEQEHTSDLMQAGRIALDHLREFPDYYTRLMKMEERAKAGLAPNPKIVSLGPQPMYAAAGLTPNRPFLDDVVDRLREVPNFTRRIGLKRVTADELEKRTIGAGAYAHAFRLDDGRVLKVTDDRDDGLAAEAVRRMGRSPGLVEVFEVWKLPGTVVREEFPGSMHGHSIRSLYAIVTEFVDPFDKKHPSIPEPSMPPSEKLNNKLIRETIAHICRNFREEADFTAIEHSSQPMTAEELDDLYTVRLKEGRHSKVGERYMADIFAGLRKLSDKGFVVRDVHLRNMGVALDGRAVMFDFGHGSQSGVALPISVEMASNPDTALPKSTKIFDECFDVVEQAFGDFGTCELHHDEKAAADNGTGSERQFGYCMDGDPIVIAFAAKIEGQPVAYIRGLMRHEFGHAVDFRYGKKHLEKLFGQKLPDGVERRADVIAELIFGDPIEYGKLDIQCIGCGGKPVRPKRLAQ